MNTRWLALRRFLLASALVPVLGHTGQVLADCPKPSQAYVGYAADVNGDGVLDYAVVPRQLMVPIPIDDDLSIVIPVRPPVVGFTLTSQAGGARVMQAIAGDQLPAGAWQPAALSFVVADVMGTGCNGLVVRGLASASSPGSTDTALVRFASTGQPSSLQVLTTGSNGYGLGDGEVQAIDKNGDGRQDLVHRVSGLVQGIYLADAQGVVRFDDDATIVAVWMDFIAAAGAREGRALLYLGSEVTQRYGNALTTDALQTLSQGIKAAGIADSTNQTASFIVQRAGPDGDVLYTVLFGKTGYGSWRITNL